MAEIFGEAGGAVARCPGESCPRFASAAGETWEERSLACRGCVRCDGNAPLPPDATEREPAIDGEVRRIERLWLLSRAGVSLTLGIAETELLAIWQSAYEGHRQTSRTYQIALLKRIAGVKKR